MTGNASTGKSTAGLYADPMLYDILYTPGTAAEVDVLERLEGRYASGSPRGNRLWFEPACGTGRYLRVAAGRGRRIAGFDRDEGQLAYARRRLPCPPGHLFAAEMTDFAAGWHQAGLPRTGCQFAFNPVNTLRHLASDAELVRHLCQVAEVLAPGALYVVGLSLVDYDWLFPDEDTWIGVRGGCRVTQLVNYLPPEPGTARARRETVISHLTVARPRGDEHFDDAYDLHCCDEREWQRVLRQARAERVATCDATGRPLDGRIVPYQLEVLRF
jgi:hypothetical protein